MKTPLLLIFLFMDMLTTAPSCETVPFTVKHKFSSTRLPSWERAIVLPTKGKFTLESHYLTKRDVFPNKFPATQTEGMQTHLQRSFILYHALDTLMTIEKLYRSRFQKEWTPAENGKIGQGSRGELQLTQLSPEDELWMMNMMWARGTIPKIGTKFLLTANGRSVVVIAGYETGPSSEKFLGGVTTEVHSFLQTNETSLIEIGFLKDQTLPAGPTRCR
jgi:hypothetical protein